MKSNNSKEYYLTDIVLSVNKYINEIHALCEGISEVHVSECNYAAIPSGFLHSFAALQCFLSTHLVLVKLGKVVDDDGNGQSDDQHSADATHSTHHLPQRCSGANVPVTDGGHCDTGPPEGLGNACVPSVGLILLSKVGQAGEDHDPDGQEQHEEPQLLVAVA